MNPPFEIRVLTSADSQECWALRLEALEREPQAFGLSAEEHRITNPEEIGSRQLRDVPDGNFTLGTFVDGKLCGIVGFVRDSHIKRRHRGSISAMYVTASCRGRGIGRAMLERLLDRIKSYEGFEIVSLGVTSADAPAFRLYSSVGFQLLGTAARALKIGDAYVDENIMELDLAIARSSSE
jgi:ribosomal protein S18 acetylase RimI-like enzyme